MHQKFTLIYAQPLLCWTIFVSSPVAIEEWWREQGSEAWKFLITNQHIGGGGSSVIQLLDWKQKSCSVVAFMTEQAFWGSTLPKRSLFPLYLTGLPCPGGSPSSGKKHELTLGTWNVQILMDNNRSEWPERRTAFVAQEPRRLNYWYRWQRCKKPDSLMKVNWASWWRIHILLEG